MLLASAPQRCRIGHAARLRALFLALATTLDVGCDDGDSRHVSTTTSTSTTTTSASTTSTTTTTTISTSTTTIPTGACLDDSDCVDAGVDCFCEFSTCHCAASQADVELELVSNVAIGALQLELGYQSVDGSFVGSGATVECESLVIQFGVFAAFNDDEVSRVVNAAFVSLTGIGGNGSLGLMRCVLRVAGELPTAGDFAIVVTDASDVNLAPVEPLPLVRVSRIELSGGGFPLR